MSVIDTFELFYFLKYVYVFNIGSYVKLHTIRNTKHFFITVIISKIYLLEEKHINWYFEPRITKNANKFKIKGKKAKLTLITDDFNV